MVTVPTDKSGNPRQVLTCSIASPFRRRQSADLRRSPRSFADRSTRAEPRDRRDETRGSHAIDPGQPWMRVVSPPCLSRRPPSKADQRGRIGDQRPRQSLVDFPAREGAAARARGDAAAAGPAWPAPDPRPPIVIMSQWSTAPSLTMSTGSLAASNVDGSPNCAASRDRLLRLAKAEGGRSAGGSTRHVAFTPGPWTSVSRSATVRLGACEGLARPRA